MSIMIKLFIKKNLLLFAVSPIIINFLINLFKGKIVLINYFINNKIVLIVFILNSYFYYSLSLKIKNSLKIRSKFLALTYFLTSFYIIDYIFFPITKYFSSKLLFNFVILLWFILLLVKKTKLKILLNLTFLYFFTEFINYVTFDKLKSLSNYVELNTDVPVQWYQLANMIYSNNLYYAFSNNLIDGHGLYLSYVQSLLFRLNFYFFEFQFIRLNSNLLIFFCLIFISDLELSTRNKLIFSATFVTFILNSDWLNYLFFDSLMLEGLVSIFFVEYINNIKKYKNNSLNLNSTIFYLCFSALFLSKQFVSLITLLLLVFVFIRYKNLNVLGGVIFLVLDYLYKKIYTPTVDSFEYLKGTNPIELALDLIKLRNLELGNIIKIINQLFLDKPFIYLLGLVFTSIIFKLVFKINMSKNFEFNVLSFVIIINFIFIFLLFIVWWKDHGIQSSYRYSLNMLLCKFLLVFYFFENLENKFSLE